MALLQGREMQSGRVLHNNGSSVCVRAFTDMTLTRKGVLADDVTLLSSNTCMNASAPYVEPRVPPSLPTERVSWLFLFTLAPYSMGLVVAQT